MIPLGVLASGYVTPAGGGLLAFIGGVVDTSDATTYTFTDVPAGTHVPGSEIVVIAYGGASGGGTVSSVSIDGVAATLDTSAYTSYATTRIARGTATGSTADIAVTFSRGQLRAGLYVYRTSGPVSVAATTRNASSTTAITLSVATASGGMIIAGGNAYSSDVETWTNVTGDGSVTAELSRFGAASAATTGGTVDVTFAAALSQLSLHVVAYAPA